ncbi:MAG: cation:proton antiporter [Longimicrobiales bacterium]|nr:cation:proton antiporter [Longimicrobiales bacterium]
MTTPERAAMDPLIATLALILIALLGSRFSFATRQVSAGSQLLLRTGTHFLLLGFLLGPTALGLLSREAVGQLSPLLGLALGWIGLLFGLQLERGALRHFPRVFLVLALGQATLVCALLLAGGLLLASRLSLAGEATMLVLAGAAATACISTPAAVAIVAANFRVKGQVKDLLYFVASLDAIVGITVLHVAYAAMHGTPVMAARGDEPVWFWVLAGVGLGVVCAVIFLWLARLRPSREELVLYLLGISALAAGAALQLQLSPLFVGTVTGVIITNLNPQWHRAFRIMERWEKPIYLILLLLAGAALRIPAWWVLPLALGYAVTRALAKVLATGFLVRVLPLPFPTPLSLGMGLVPQGGISIAMAISLSLTLRSSDARMAGVDAADLLFATVIVGVVISDLVGPFLTTRLLRSGAGGERDPRGAADHAPDRTGTRAPESP